LRFENERRRLADSLVAEGLLRSEDVRRAFLRVHREGFVWPGTEEQAYFDMPLSLGGTGQTISAPHMVVIMLEALRPQPGDVVLEVGTGSGYNAALLAEMVAPGGGPKGRVVSVERVPELVAFARKNLGAAGYSDRVEVLLKDGTLGTPDVGTLFDGIMVTAAAPRIPAALKKQLKVGGTLLIPVGPLGYQYLIRTVRVMGDRFEEEDLGACVFVPLVGEDGY
jgi:protein-L-isoaspartate(D-aspartate) O-methyltransferase